MVTRKWYWHSGYQGKKYLGSSYNFSGMIRSIWRRPKYLENEWARWPNGHRSRLLSRRLGFDRWELEMMGHTKVGRVPCWDVGCPCSNHIKVMANTKFWRVPCWDVGGPCSQSLQGDGTHQGWVSSLLGCRSCFNHLKVIAHTLLGS